MDEAGQELSATDFEAVGLYDPTAEHADRTLELLRLLAANGATLEQMIEAADRLPTLVTRLQEEHRQIYTAADAAALAGTTADVIRQAWRAAGFVDPGTAIAFSESDLVALRLLIAGEAFVGHDAALTFVRVLGSAAARVADAAVSLFVVNIAKPSFDEDPAGLELARAGLRIAELLPTLETAIGTLVRHHLELAQRSVDEVQASADVDALPLAVGFVDIVESTAMTRLLEPTQMSALLQSFEGTMSDLIAARGGRLVKLIGDEAMFLTRNPHDAWDIALQAIETFRDSEPHLELRAGLAFGDVILRGGDGFGSVVNLAARLVKLAEPNGVIIDAGLATQARSDAAIDVGDIVEQAVKGFDEPVRFATLRRAASAT